MKVSKFSDGSIDEYKGRRNVKAGWAIFDSSGNRVDCGHSLSRELAFKTARNSLRQKIHNSFPRKVEFATPEYVRYRQQTLAKMGFEGRRAHDDYLKNIENLRNMLESSSRIEVVDL